MEWWSDGAMEWWSDGASSGITGLRHLDRTGEFEPQFIRKGQKRFGGFDTKIIAMYAQGMTVREIKRFLEEQYKVEVSADLISTVTDSVMEDVVEWQNRPLEPMYVVVFFDA